MVPIIIIVGTSAIVTPSIVASAIIAPAEVAVIISVTPIRSVSIIIPVSVVRCAVVGTWAVVAGPEKKRDWNR